MKVCRFDDNRIGIVRDGLVHDVTPLLPSGGHGGGRPGVMLRASATGLGNMDVSVRAAE